MGEHVVGNVDGASREGDAAIQRHMQKDFDHLLLGEAEVQRSTDVAAQRAFPAQRGQAEQGRLRALARLGRWKEVKQGLMNLPTHDPADRDLKTALTILVEEQQETPPEAAVTLAKLSQQFLALRRRLSIDPERYSPPELRLDSSLVPSRVAVKGLCCFRF